MGAGMAGGQHLINSMINKKQNNNQQGGGGPQGIQCQCGTMNAAGQRFCSGCGNSLQQQAPPPQAQGGVQCTACNAQIAPGARFCNGCGAAAPAGPPVCNGCGAAVTGKFCNSCGTPA
jgi:hypothetical protein